MTITTTSPHAQRQAEALAFFAAVDPDAADYPLLSAEVGITAPTLIEVAHEAHADYLRWEHEDIEKQAAGLLAKAGVASGVKAVSPSLAV